MLFTEKLFFSSVIFLLLFTLRLYGATPELCLNSYKEEYSLENYLYLTDNNNTIKDEEIISGKFEKFFLRNHASLHLTGKEHSTYWLKFNVKNSTTQQKKWILEFYDFKIDNISFYFQKEDGSYSVSKAGDSFPFSIKHFFHKNIEFELPDIKNKTFTCYVRVETSEVVALTFLVRSYQQLLNYALKEYVVLGLYYGIIVIIVFLNLFIFFTSRDYVYLYYVWYVFSIALFSLIVVDGIGFQFLWPSFPKFNLIGVPLASYCLVVSALWYGRSFLLLSSNFPFLNKFFITIIVLRSAVFVLDFKFHFYDTWNPFYDWGGLFIVYVAGIYCYLKGYKPARYYVVAFTFVFIGYLVFAMGNRGLISSNFVTVYALNYAVAIELILLSLALAERIEAFKKERTIALQEKMKHLLENKRLQENIIAQLRENETLKDQVNTRLEEKVRERTADLLQAQEQIEAMNRLLNDDNKTLKSSVKKLYKDRIMHKVVTFEEFQNIYPDEKSCYEFIENLKWGKGFKCAQCGNTKFARGNMPYSRRCSKCGLIESVTAGTIFFRLKFSVVKAFYLVFLVSTNQAITSEELSTNVTLRKQTCWAFKKKIIERIERTGKKRGNGDGWSHLIMGAEATEVEL